MKHLLFLTLLFLLAASSAFSQPAGKKHRIIRAAIPAAKPAPVQAAGEASPSATSELPPVRQKPSSDILKEIPIGEWAVTSISIPEDLTDRKYVVHDSDLLGAKYKSYVYSWKQSADYSPSALEVSLQITNWKGTIKELFPDYPPDKATPEYHLSQILYYEVKAISEPNAWITEARAMTINNFEGAYSRHRHSTDADRAVIEWVTYRNYRGKFQFVLVTVTGAPDELEKGLKIIQSLKLQPTA